MLKKLETFGDGCFPKLKTFAENLTFYIQNKTENMPLVISLDAPWGCGKTTFLNMWAKDLGNKKKFTVIKFNAWEADYCENPLIALITELNEQLKEEFKINNDNNNDCKELKNLAEKSKHLIVKCLPALGKLLLNVGLNWLKVGEEVKEFAQDIAKTSEEFVMEEMASHHNRKNVVTAFKDSLRDIIILTQKPLLILIDELDRCKPIFAIELLEVIKHLFDIEKCGFVLAMNHEAIAHTVRKVYGGDFNAHGYLERFFDRHIYLPKPEKETFVDKQIMQLSSLNELSSKDELFKKVVLKLADYFYSLRDIEKYIIELDNFFTTVKNRVPVFYFPVIAFLIALRKSNDQVYNDYLNEKLGANSHKKMTESLNLDLGSIDNTIFKWLESLFFATNRKEDFSAEYLRLEREIDSRTRQNKSKIESTIFQKLQQLETEIDKICESGKLFLRVKCINHFQVYTEIVSFIDEFKSN